MATGIKTGGRRKGTPNKPKEESEAQRAGARGPDTPEFLSSIKKAAPVFPKYRIERTDSLAPYANNARTHSQEQIDRIAASIAEFGFTNPILINKQRGIIAGHGRVLAAQMLGLETVPVIELAHLTAAQRRAYIIADNKLAELAGWDEDLLALELGELRKGNFDIGLIGFDADELASLFSDPDDDPSEPAANGKRKVVACPECGHHFAP